MSWNVVKLSTVCNIDMGSAPKGSTYVELGEGVPLIAGAADYGEVFPQPKKSTLDPTKLCEKGDIILCVRATIGDLNWADKTYCLGRGVAGLRAHDEKLDAKYLWYFIRSIENELYLNSTGSTFPQINKKVIESIQIPLPQLETQKKIAAVLEKADQLRKDCLQMEQDLNSLAQSVFIEMFGDPITNPKGLELKCISYVANVITGNTPSRAKSEYYGSDIEWIKSGNINTPSDYLTMAEEYLSEKGKAVGRTVGAGSVLMTCIAGSPECIGNIAITDRNVAFNQQINALVPKKNILNTEFLYVLLKVGKKIIQAASTNSMKGMISKSKLEAIRLPFPNYIKQCEFSDIYCKLQKIVKEQEQQVFETELMFNALMQKTFNGEHDLNTLKNNQM
ncbi:restriction endonuclease subunit S [Aeromonas sp. QDB03]|uniref:restriction endonuclease subunit S n=1 Tax=Aeromonas sp. QDB03 TaxID=2989839 RepID=UPI0022E06ECD|nr:restriction endonuclease subunit S [Aeromonas sp. QDB03]